jgi:hypothetical protein
MLPPTAGGRQIGATPPTPTGIKVISHKTAGRRHEHRYIRICDVVFELDGSADLRLLRWKHMAVGFRRSNRYMRIVFGHTETIMNWSNRQANQTRRPKRDSHFQAFKYVFQLVVVGRMPRHGEEPLTRTGIVRLPANLTLAGIFYCNSQVKSQCRFVSRAQMATR